jgi:hypothetical protein
MGSLAVVRWRKYGHDRLYVKTLEGDDVGWVDVVTGRRTLHRTDLAAEFERALSDRPELVEVAPPESPVVAPPTSWLGEPGWEDLATHAPGAGVRQKAQELRAERPMATVVARVLGVHTEERGWRAGAEGEELVGRELTKLARKDPRWRVLHSVPVGDRGSDIDHLVIGPPGVFSLNTKNHRGAKLWVGGDGFLVNGQRQPYVRNSRFEAERATELLTTVSDFPVWVTGVIVVVNQLTLKVRQQPDDVRVMALVQLRKWLGWLPEAFTPEQIDAVFEQARRSTTWVRG